MANNALQRFGSRLLGLKINDPSDVSVAKTNKILTTHEDGSTIIEGVGPIANYGYWNANFTFDNENDLINKFRDMSLNTYCDRVINEIVNTSIAFEDETGCDIEIDLDNTDYSDTVKDIIVNEWNQVLNLLDFKNNGQSLFRDWYIDGRIYYQKIIDKTDLKKGIIELRRIDATEIKKIKQIERKVDNETGALIIEKEDEYYLYTPKYNGAYSAGSEVLLNIDAVASSNSGLYIYKEEPTNSYIVNKAGNTIRNRYVVSYLYPMIKPLNQLNIVEEAGLINLVARAPERRIHYVDVAGLPKSKADEAMRDYAKSIKNNLQYNSETGTFNSDTNVLTMQDDLIIPRRNGTNAAEITALPGVQTNNNIDIIDYFKKKFYMSSHVALSRMTDDNGSFLGRSSEINRDELNMSKFCNNLRMKFVELPLDVLRTQLILKNIVTPGDWKQNKNKIIVRYSTDSFISELREIEITQEKIAALRDIEPYIGRFYSEKFINKHILGLSEEQIANMKKEIQLENIGTPVNNNMDGESHITNPLASDNNISLDGDNLPTGLSKL